MTRTFDGLYKTRDLTDRERILLTLVDRLASTMLLTRCGYERENYCDHVHFANYEEPRPGDLVLAKTGRVSPWKVAFYVEKLPGEYAGALVREIGTDRLCRYGNESFVPVRGLDPATLLEGWRHRYRQRVLAAFRRGDEYSYRFGGLEFDGADAVVTMRAVFGGLGSRRSKPFSVRWRLRKNDSVKTILRHLREGGYGTRKFEEELK